MASYAGCRQAHRGVPWRKTRQVDGARIDNLPGPELADRLRALVTRAEASAGAGDRNARALLAVVAAVRADRRTAPVDPATWAAARRCANRLGTPLTRSELDAAVTHEVLLLDSPVAVLAAAHGLTRRDLDLGLAHARALPATPSGASRAALRGCPQGSDRATDGPVHDGTVPVRAAGDGPAA